MRPPLLSLLGLIFAVTLYHVAGFEILAGFAGGFLLAEWSWALENGYWRR